jgi:UDPglucose 6-dehydrogenase
LSFKADTDDIRNAPAIHIIKALQQAGAKVKVYDPVAMPKARSLLPGAIFSPDPYGACRGSDCVAVVTDWDAFKQLDFKKIKKLLKRPVVIDGRNIYDPEALTRLGFTYVAIGRKKGHAK